MTLDIYLGISLTPRDVRCIVVNLEGETLGTSTASLNVDESRDPDAWWLALKTALRELAGGGIDLLTVRAIGLAGTPYGAVFLDDGGAAITPATVAGDQEAAAYCAYLESTARRSRAINGNLAKPDMLGVALVHLREEAPETFKRLATVLAPKDYLMWRLTGQKATDPSTASTSLLFDPLEKTWAPRILKPLGLQTDKLPKLVASDTSVGPLLDAAANETGLAVAPVVAGASGLAAMCVCLGLEHAGENLLVLGERTNLVRLSTTFLPDPFRHIDMRASTKDGVFFHLADTGPAADFDAWAHSLETSAHDNAPETDLYFLPHLGHGAALAGLSPRATPQDIARAVLHGAAFEIAESLAAMNDLFATEEPLQFLASPSLGRAWGPFLASATDTALEFHEDDGFSIARGAAGLARKSQAGKNQKKPEPAERFLPQPDLKARFDRVRPKLAGLKSRLTHSG